MLLGDKFREMIECRLQSSEYQAKADDIGSLKYFIYLNIAQGHALPYTLQSIKKPQVNDM